MTLNFGFKLNNHCQTKEQPKKLSGWWWWWVGVITILLSAKVQTYRYFMTLKF